MFRFAHPEYLYALYILPFLIVLYWVISRKKKKDLGIFAEIKLHSVLFPAYSSLKGILKYGILLFAVFLMIVSAANPQIGTRIQEVKQSGIDVYICLDVSLSMQAQDIKPSRLEKAKYEISNLINKLHGDRIGLIIFAGQAYVQFPLTTDYSAANLFLNAVDQSSVPQQGTAIASAVNLAVESFGNKYSTQKVIVVITDGEDHEGDVNKSVIDAKDKGVKIYTIGLGSPDGVPIPVYDNNGQPTGFKKDNQGNTVLTKLDEKSLEEIASAGEGKYFRGSNNQDELDLIYKDLSSLQKAEFGVKKVTDYEDRFYYFLAPAILLLILEFFISQRKSKLFGKLNKKLGLS